MHPLSHDRYYTCAVHDMGARGHLIHAACLNAKPRTRTSVCIHTHIINAKHGVMPMANGVAVADGGGRQFRRGGCEPGASSPRLDKHSLPHATAYYCVCVCAELRVFCHKFAPHVVKAGGGGDIVGNRPQTCVHSDTAPTYTQTHTLTHVDRLTKRAAVAVAVVDDDDASDSH